MSLSQEGGFRTRIMRRNKQTSESGRAAPRGEGTGDLAVRNETRSEIGKANEKTWRGLGPGSQSFSRWNGIERAREALPADQAARPEYQEQQEKHARSNKHPQPLALARCVCGWQDDEWERTSAALRLARVLGVVSVAWQAEAGALALSPAKSVVSSCLPSQGSESPPG